jgi:hypothetical protein
MVIPFLDNSFAWVSTLGFKFSVLKGLAAESKAKKNRRRNRRIWVQLWWDDGPLV